MESAVANAERSDPGQMLLQALEFVRQFAVSKVAGTNLHEVLFQLLELFAQSSVCEVIRSHVDNMFPQALHILRNAYRRGVLAADIGHDVGDLPFQAFDVFGHAQGSGTLRGDVVHLGIQAVQMHFKLGDMIAKTRSAQEPQASAGRRRQPP